eukprot:TRINITY_DN110747_c0_g1_i1.p1 TRINITY_DN110747_c0_g1~~TRINITY_DN110747_c0_g1_i1.p1  ORF type:complete len:616 (+),score=139.99 TRINITY_DN110747_c0_g1_i1:124-1971(+)
MSFSLSGQAGLWTTVRFCAFEAVWDALQNPAYKELLSVLSHERQTLVFAAVQRNDSQDALKICTYLVDVIGLPAAHEDHIGQTALHYAAKTAHVECVKFLVARGCNVDHADELMKQTPLFYAAKFSNAAMLQNLVALRANANSRDKHGQTPLFYVQRLEMCKTLVMACDANCGANDSRKVSAINHHRRHVGQSEKESQAISAFLTMCSELRAERRRFTWSHPGIPSASGFNPGYTVDSAGVVSVPPVYVTSLARACDVEQLCQLEVEFIDDHREFYKDLKLTEEALFEQIGLNPCADTRRNTIVQIASTSVRVKRESVRHYTLKCQAVTADSEGNKSKRLVGYVYFRIVNGIRTSAPNSGMDAAVDPAASTATNAAADKDAPSSEKSEEAAAAPKRSPGRRGAAKKAHTPPSLAHLVISHLKVCRSDQRRGVGKLLLAGMLRFAETDLQGAALSDLYLSVVEKNDTAVELYRRLGFTEWGREPGQIDWIKMRRAMVGESAEELGLKWLGRVPGSSTAPLQDKARGPRGLPACKKVALPKKRAVSQTRAPLTAVALHRQVVAATEFSPGDDGQAGKKRKLPESPDNALSVASTEAGSSSLAMSTRSTSTVRRNRSF